LFCVCVLVKKKKVKRNIRGGPPSPFFFSGSECCACGRCPAGRRTAYDGRPVDSAYALAKRQQMKELVLRFIPDFLCARVCVSWLFTTY
jgi:hypothetical protein